jgi:hypothetical protein
VAASRTGLVFARETPPALLHPNPTRPTPPIHCTSLHKLNQGLISARQQRGMDDDAPRVRELAPGQVTRLGPKRLHVAAGAYLLRPCECPRDCLLLSMLRGVQSLAFPLWSQAARAGRRARAAAQEEPEVSAQ